MNEGNYLLDHEIYNTVDTMKLKFNAILDNEDFLAELSVNGMNTINRLESIVTFLLNRLNSTDPYLLAKSNLDAINMDLNRLFPIIDSYQEKMTDNAQLVSINQHCDKLSIQISNILYGESESDFDAIKTSVVSLRKSVGQHKYFLEKQQEEFEEKTLSLYEKINKIDGVIHDLKSGLENSVKEYEDKYKELYNSFVNSQENRSKDFLDLKQKLTEAANESEKQLENQINEVLSGLDSENNKQKEKINNNFQEIRDSLQEQSDGMVRAMKDSKEEYDKELQKHKASIEELVGLVSTSAVSAHFKEVADRYRILSYIWQTLTILGFIVTIGFGIYSFVFNENQLEAYNLIARIIVTTAIGSFTGYAARQATKNEKNEKSNREMEVELKTLNPYIASFDEKDRIDLKKIYFSKIFHEEIPQHGNHLDSTQED